MRATAGRGWRGRRGGWDAIAASCGFLARWQRELQAALPVPVWSSALLQLAEQQLQGRRCGVITIEAAALGAAHFEVVGADPATLVEGIIPLRVRKTNNMAMTSGARHGQDTERSGASSGGARTAAHGQDG